MRVIADLSSGSILQVEKTPDLGALKPFNGRVSVAVPEGAALDVGPSSYVLPVDGGDVSSLAMTAFFVQFPMYENILFNPLLTASDIADLDLTATGPSGEITRAQVGRGVGPLVLGHAPNGVAILPTNNSIAPTRPGCLVTNTIDITVPTSGAGADEFLVWWKLYEFETSHDVMSDFGATNGLNTPAIRSIKEIDQEPGGFQVYLSHDDGVTWSPIGRMEPTDMVTYGTLVRLAFVNTSSVKYFLSSFALMF